MINTSLYYSWLIVDEMQLSERQMARLNLSCKYVARFNADNFIRQEWPKIVSFPGNLQFTTIIRHYELETLNMNNLDIIRRNNLLI